MDGTLTTYENNSMSLSCRGEAKIEDGVVTHVKYKGYPRTRGRDAWLAFYEMKNKGDSVAADEIETMLKCNGKNNIVSVFRQVDR